MFSMELQIGVLLYIFFSSLQSQAKWPILSTKIDWMGQIKFMYVLEISPLELFSHDELQLHWASKKTYHFFSVTFTEIHCIKMIHIWTQIR